jgi:hypothetical protein
METRRENRPVSRTCASSLLTPDVRLLCARRTEPHARSPPRTAPLESRALLNAACSGCATANPPGKTSRCTRPQSGERRCDNIASPERRTRKASPSYS